MKIHTTISNRYLSVFLATLLILALSPLHTTNAMTADFTQPITFDSIIEDHGAYNGQPLSDIEPDSSFIAIKSVDDSNGQWQWFNGTQWLNISDRLSPDSMLVLTSDTLIRFSAIPDWNGTTTIDYSLYIEGSGDPDNVNSFEQEIRTASLTVTPVGDAPYLTEVGGNNYLGFNEFGAYATYPSMDIYTDSFTFESWVKIPFRFNAWERIFDTSYGMDNFNLHLAFEGGTGRMVFEALPQQGYRTNTYQSRTQDSFPLNQWVHVAVVYNHSLKQSFIYWNGVLKGQGFMDLTNMANASLQNGGISRPINYLGKSTWNQDGYFKGGLRDVRFWNKAKLQSEVINQMNIQVGSTEANLLVEYPFNEGNGQLASSLGTITEPSSLHNTDWLTEDGFIYGVTGTKGSTRIKEYTIHDADMGDVEKITTTAVSSNQTVLPDSAIQLAGTGENQKIIMKPIEEGSTTITVTLNDGNLTYQSSYILNVTSLPTGEQLPEPPLEEEPGEDQPGDGQPDDEQPSDEQPEQPSDEEQGEQPNTPETPVEEQNENQQPTDQLEEKNADDKILVEDNKESVDQNKVVEQQEEGSKSAPLPKTGTDMYSVLALGLSLICIAIAAFIAVARKRNTI
ncbi:LamG-like jellyroll fold domain-containing protein [Fredinandcohnia sp. 179-A 10B2 NHS]|uniref:LamG domain-containing protein n=1 Tax=Fredinandcohnia sp. 179-A 10B2 NHS TaxID=3235176 RepID=UPI0039A1BB43